MWPGFGENMRVLKWIVDRVRGRATNTAESPFGYMPRYDDLNWAGLDFSKERFAKIMDVDADEANAEADAQAEHFAQFGIRLPTAMEEERMALKQRLQQAEAAE